MSVEGVEAAAVPRCVRAILGEAQQGQGCDSSEDLCSLGDNPFPGLVLTLERL